MRWRPYLAYDADRAAKRAGPGRAPLKVAGEGLADASGDVALDTVLGKIDLRVAVELAKTGIRQPQEAAMSAGP